MIELHLITEHFVVFIMVQTCSKLLQHALWHLALCSEDYKSYTSEINFKKDL